MRFILFAAALLAVLTIAGCVNVDLGQASKDWSEVGKSFADAYKEGQVPPASVQTPAQVPPGQ